MANILIIDDDLLLCDALSSVILSMGHVIDSAQTLQEGIKKLDTGEFAVVILDVWLPDGNGLDALASIRQTPSEPEVIILTGVGEPDGAELAVRSGAWDYITKPPTLNKIKLPVQRALEYHDRRHRMPKPIALKRNGIIGDSPAMRTCLEKVAQAASIEANVSIIGETGTGKELIAHAIHQNSRRKDRPFVTVDCAALSDNLFKSTLFGHVKGAFTGADRNVQGLVKQADGGVLFLDEIGELPLVMQKALLRVLQEKTFRPLGSEIETRSEFRVICATNKDLETMVKRWEFREDLLFRLRTITIEAPPLRNRQKDIETLTCYFIEHFCAEMNIAHKGFSRDFLEAFESYDWPGNIRELISTVESALAASGPDAILTSQHLPMEMRIKLIRKSITPASTSANKTEPSGAGLPGLKEFRKAAIAELEKQYLHELVLKTAGNIPTACKVSGLSRARLYSLLRQHKVPLR